MKLRMAARSALLDGIKKVAEAVSSTLGPKGRLAIIDKGFGELEVTKDGVTVAKSIKIEEDQWQSMGAELLKQAAIKTNDIAGDGTTTATLLTSTLASFAVDALDAGEDPVKLKNQIDSCIDKVKAHISSIGVDIKHNVDHVLSVATIAANNDRTIGKLIGQAYEKVGPAGTIIMAPSENDKSHVVIVEGMEFPAGFVSPYLITNQERQEIEYVNPLILIVDKEITDVQSIKPAVDYAAANERPIIIVAESFEQSALSVIIRNKVSGGLKIAVMKMPGFGDFKKEGFQDLAAFVGANLITSELGRTLDHVGPDDLGSCERFLMTKGRTLFSGGKGDAEAYEVYADNIKKQIPSETTYNEGKHKERIKRLSGVVATIYVGAITEGELREKMYRVEDAINAVQSAVAEGVVPGGGTALLSARSIASECMPLYTALAAPFNKILENAGVDPTEIKYRDIQNGMGFDVLTMETGNMWDLGILDTVRAINIALDAAKSVTGIVLMTDVLIHARQSQAEALPLR